VSGRISDACPAIDRVWRSTAPCDRPWPAIDRRLGHGSPKKVIDGNQWIIYGTEYPVDAFGNIFWKDRWTLGLSSGLLVSLMSD
jgi:hypothetical protein